jgi:hypothetical protein
MRKSSFYLFVLAVALIMGSCGGEKKQSNNSDAVLPKPDMELSAADTAEVISLTNQFIERLRANKFDEAIGMVYYLNNDSLETLSADRARAQKYLLQRFKGVRYDVDFFRFKNDYDNVVKYTVTLFEKENEEDPRPNTTSFFLKPVRQEGKWFLTMADAMATD